MKHDIRLITALFMATGSLFASAVIPPTADADPGSTLSVTVERVAEPRGQIMIAIFKGEEAYKTNQPIQATAASVEGDSVTAEFSLEPGEYGIKLYHDVNGDGEMNTNPFGMPTEPFGFSNNAPVRFGPPGWNAAKFEIGAEGASQIISIN